MNLTQLKQDVLNRCNQMVINGYVITIDIVASHYDDAVYDDVENIVLAYYPDVQ